MSDLFIDFTKQEKSSRKIQSRYFTPCFKDPLLEEKYLTNILSKKNYIFLAFLIIFIFSEIGMIIYGSFYIKNPELATIFYCFSSLCLVGNAILSFLYYWFVKSPSKKSFMELASIILFTISLITYLFSFIVEGVEFNFTRIIYLLIFSKYFSLLIWSQTHFLVWAYFFACDVAVIITCSFVSKKYIFEDIGVEIIICIFSFILKKNSDLLNRNYFVENFKKQKYKEYFEYSKKLINSMSGLHMTFSTRKLIYTNDNVRNLLKKMMASNNFRSN